MDGATGFGREWLHGASVDRLSDRRSGPEDALPAREARPSSSAVFDLAEAVAFERTVRPA